MAGWIYGRKSDRKADFEIGEHHRCIHDGTGRGQGDDPLGQRRQHRHDCFDERDGGQQGNLVTLHRLTHSFIPS